MDPTKGSDTQIPAQDQNSSMGGSNPPLGRLDPQSPTPVSSDLGANTQSNPLNPEVPQPLNTTQTPTVMPAGDPLPPAGGPEGLPAQLPNTQTNHSPGGSRKMMIGI